MRPKIISIGFVVPERSYTQEEVFLALGYSRHFRRIFGDAGIDKRHLWLPLNSQMSWQEATEEYKKGAIWLSRQAVKACLNGRDAGAIGGVSYASCTGYECPSIMHRLHSELGFSPNVVYTPILGTGCEGAAPALWRAYHHTLATGQQSLAISCELCSVCHFPESEPDPSGEWELLRANAIFGDGASAALIGFDDNPRHPYLVDFETYFNPDNLKHLGFVWQDGRLRVLLSRQIPKIVPSVVQPPVEKILQRHHLSQNDIKWWVIHPGGSAVLDNLRDKLGIPEEKMVLSREVLRLYGNCSSASIGIVGKLLMGEDVRLGDWGLIVSLGAGLAAGATLLRWGKE
ncbi:Alpha-pyrone synthesis polyketide synthase-like Pks11 [subsurface metagenome]